MRSRPLHALSRLVKGEAGGGAERGPGLEQLGGSALAGLGSRQLTHSAKANEVAEALHAQMLMRQASGHIEPKATEVGITPTATEQASEQAAEQQQQSASSSSFDVGLAGSAA